MGRQTHCFYIFVCGANQVVDVKVSLLAECDESGHLVPLVTVLANREGGMIRMGVSVSTDGGLVVFESKAGTM